MAYTPDELICELNDLGYPVTKRRLTDWAQKGLLPSPRPRGRGQGRGKVYRWIEPDVLHRAIDVFELLDWHRRAQDLFLPLWVLGYDVPVTEVRAGLEKHVDGLARGLDAAIPFRGDRTDLISDLLVTAETQIAAQADDFLIPLAAAFLNAFIDPATRDWTVLVEELLEVLTSREDGTPTWPDPGGAAEAAAFVRDQLSVPRLREIVTTTNDDDLILAHRDLRTVMQWARALANVALDIEPWMFTRLLVFFGIWGAVLDLALRQGGHGATVDRSIGAFVDGCHRLLTDPRLRTEMQRLRAEQGAPTTSDEERDDVADAN